MAAYNILDSMQIRSTLLTPQPSDVALDPALPTSPDAGGFT